MEKPKLGDIEDVVEQLVLPFYAIKRDMVLPLDERREEFDSEHAWSVALIACSLAPEVDPSLDVGLIAQMSTIHDLVEVFSGDTSIWASKDELASKEEREANAVNEIREKFGAVFPWIPNIIDKYESQDTKEALFVRAVDKLIPMIFRHLDNGKGYRDIGMTKDKFTAGIVATTKKAHADPIIAAYWDEIITVITNEPNFFANELS